MPLSLLDEKVRSRLRSGVAITSMAQCVGELVENAIDAGAKCIAVRVDVSKYKIQVIDSGGGVSRKDLNLIGQRYATSKCHTIADLDHSLQHLGYRGEALASTINCSGTVEIQSRYRLSQETYSKIFLHGTAMPVTLCPAQRPSVGTTITVHDFFYNLPVRRRLIKEDLELENIRLTLLCVALANPSISFSLRNDMIGECVLQTRRTNSVLASFSVLFGSSKASSMKELIFEHSIFRITGYISTECHHGKQLQFVYVNGRLVKKTALHSCVNNLIANSLIARSLSRQADARGCGLVADITSPRRTSEKHGMYVLMVKCPRTEYDVCLEPAKTLIEFRDWDVVLDCLTQVVKQFLVKYSLTLGPEYMGSEEGGEEGGEECQEGGREGREGHEEEGEEGEGCEEGDEGYQEGDREGRDGREEEGDGCEEEGEGGEDVARCSEHFCDPEATAPGEDGGASRDASSVREWVSITGNGMDQTCKLEQICSSRLEQNCSDGLDVDGSEQSNSHDGSITLSHSKRTPNMVIDVRGSRPKEHGARKVGRTAAAVLRLDRPSRSPLNSRSTASKLAGFLRGEKPKLRISRNATSASGEDTLQAGRPVSTVNGQQRQDDRILANRTLPAGTAPAIADLRVTQHTVTASTGLDGQRTVLPDTASASLSHGQLTAVQQNLPLLSYVTATLSSVQERFPLNTLPRTLSREQQPAMPSNTQQSLPLNNSLPLNTLPRTLSCEQQPAMPSNTQQSFPLNIPRTLSREQQPTMPSSTQQSLPLNTLPRTLSREQQPAIPSSTQQSVPFPRTLNHEHQPAIPSSMLQESELQDANAASDIGEYRDTIPNCDGPVMQNTALSTRLRCGEQSLCNTAPTEASTQCHDSGVLDDATGSMQPSDISEHFNPTRPQSAAALLPAPQISYPDCALCHLDGSIQPASGRAPSASGDFGWIASPVATDTCVSSARFEHGVGGCVAAVDPGSCTSCSCFESSRRLLNLSSCECQVSRGSVPAINVTSSLSSSCFECQHSMGFVPAINLSSSLSSSCFECQVSVPVANLNTCEQADLAVPSYSDQESDRVVSEPNETGSASLGEIWKELYDPVTSKKVYIHSRTGNSYPSLPFSCTGSDSDSGLAGSTSTGLDSGGGGGGDSGGSDGNAEMCMVSPCYGVRPIAAAPHLSHDFDCFLPGAKRLKLDDSTGLGSHSNPSGDQLGNDVDQSQDEAWRAKEDTGPFESLLRNWKNPAILPGQEGILGSGAGWCRRSQAKVHNIINHYKFSKEMLGNAEVLGQVDKKFIACILDTKETGQHNLLVCFDQHAAHERVRLENLHAGLYESGSSPDSTQQAPIKSSKVHPPLPINLTSAERKLATTFQKQLKNLGVTLVQEGGSVGVVSLPSVMMDREASEVKRGRPAVALDMMQDMIVKHLEVLRATSGGCSAIPPSLTNVLNSQACHSAIKFGDPLTADECSDLIRSLSKCKLPFQCAHGRPSVVPILDLDLLNKRYQHSQPQTTLRKLCKKLSAKLLPPSL